jgi:chromosomal replication initiation ATPase DnaA
MGGWEEAKTAHKGKEHIRGDERILGDSDFVMAVLRTSGEQLTRKSQLKASGTSLEKLTGRVAALFEIEPDKILSPGKYKQIVDARSILCYWAVRELDISATELAKKLRLTQPAVSISVKRGETLVKEKGLVFTVE